MIEVQCLSKQFGGVTAVRELSFQAPDGAITGLLGCNGAGKTTTLRMICGVLRPQGGCIRIDGRTPDGDAHFLQRNVGALLDHLGLYARLSTLENVVYFGRLHGLAPACLADRAEELVSMLGLESIADRRAGKLSQGEIMKVALARAMVHSPKNLLLDEPTNGLDVPTVRSLRTFLRRARDLGACIVFSSHVLDEVRALCDKLVIISQGSLVAQGTPEEICHQTRTASLEDAFVRLTAGSEAMAC